MRGAGARRRRRGAARQLVAVAILAFGLLVAAAFASVGVQANAVARDGAAIRGEIAQLEAELAAKRATASEKQTDQYVTVKARELGWVALGEALVSVRRDDASARSAAVGAVPVDAIRARVGRWIALYFR